MRKGHLIWGEYPKSFSLRVEAPTCLGLFCAEDAQLRNATLARGEAGSFEEGNKLVFSWLIDNKGIVVDALFSAFGDSLLIGCAETLCERSIGKPYERALSINAAELETLVLGKQISGRIKRIVSLVLEARDQLFTALSLPCQEQHPEWETLSKEERLHLIREAIERYIMPYLQRDGGGIEVQDLIDGKRVSIQFQGACVDCMGSSGSTFLYIQHLLKQQVHHSLVLEMPRGNGNDLS
jgi:NifU-like protein